MIPILGRLPSRRGAARRREAPQRLAMATLVVGALGLGTGKREAAVAVEIFASFGLDLAALEAKVHQRTPDRAAKLREVAAKELSGAAPNTGAIVAVIVRTSGLLAAMVKEVYELLSDHDATTTGTTDDFHILPGDVDDVELTLSRAFFEDVARLVSQTITSTVATLDSDALRAFVGFDEGVPYGLWPPVTDRGSGGFPLAAGVLQAGEAVQYLETRAVAEPDWAEAARVARGTLDAADRLVQAAESIVTGFASHLSDLADTAPDGVPVLAYVAEHAYGVSPESDGDDVTHEVERYLHDGFLGASTWLRVGDNRVAHEVGMSKGHPIVKATEGSRRYVSPIADLATWCSMFREGLDPGMRTEQRAGRTTPEDWTVWLELLGTACIEAAAWFATTLVVLRREITGERVLEGVTQLLNLPLWDRRDLLYEVWLLSATMRACEQAGWTVTLTGLDSDTRAWVLPGQGAGEPVAYLDCRPGEQLEVWREPRRTTADRPLTPDVTISTPGPWSRDLVVVEAKDQIKMAEGAALETARKYADGLSPRVTWVCNHCAFRSPGQAEQNHGDPWHAIHVADVVRPGSVPAVFAETIGAAIRPLRAGGARRL